MARCLAMSVFIKVVQRAGREGKIRVLKINLSLYSCLFMACVTQVKCMGFMRLRALVLVFFSFVLGASYSLASAYSVAGKMSAEEYFDRAQESAEELRTMANEIFDLESKQKGLSKELLAPYSSRLQGASASYRHNLRMSANGGHPIAAYLLASLLIREALTNREKIEEACRLYRASAEKKLLAGAIANFHKCNTAYLRFQLDHESQQGIIEELGKLLSGQDPSIDYYPLPVESSICFTEFYQPDSMANASLAEAMKALAPTILSYDQFRAEAHYLLVMLGDDNDRADLMEKLEQVKIAQALGCEDKFGFQKGIEKRLGAK